MPVAGLQPCDRSKITLISTTRPQEGGFGRSRLLEFIGGLSALYCGVASLSASWRDAAATCNCIKLIFH
jgi:hypothetical protein